jgi:glycosyltransferase involved in cell wall biosynthesis
VGKRRKANRSRRRSVTDIRRLCAQAGELARAGRYDEARKLYEKLARSTDDPALIALAENNLAVLAAAAGDLESAGSGFAAALQHNPDYEPARANAALLNQPVEVPGAVGTPRTNDASAVKVAVVSFLFNWPSTGGGIVHTLELCRFLRKAGYQVEHFYARYHPWGIGNVTQELGFRTHPIDFDAETWKTPAIQSRFVGAIEAFDPDYVIITDSWNFKPLLAQALRRWPYLLRFQALECLCPLNNVRLLFDPNGQVQQCAKHQLATPEECWRCVATRGQFSGSLHQAERALSGVGSPEYDRVLRQALAEAEAVLVVNPLMETMLAPYARRVVVAPSGMDPARFPWPWSEEPSDPEAAGKTIIFFAGLVDEPMKGFAVLDEACRQLWRRRQDFELVATAEPAGRVNPYTRFIGWQSQTDLPRRLRAADILAFPTIAQEALGRTAVEAMACGRPVVASRLGGLAFTVADGATGLLCEPGDGGDLASKLETLLDDPEMRRRMGEAGRKRFAAHYTWDVVIERKYRPLLVPRGRRQPSRPVLSYQPFIPDRVDHDRLMREVADVLGVSYATARSHFDEYRSLHERQGYAATLGELKTLCFEEAYVLYVFLATRRPTTVVEIGTQYGKATRRLLDMQKALGLTGRIVTVDRTNEVCHFISDEAELLLVDLNGRVRFDVFERFHPDLVFLDAHPYALLKEVVTESLAHSPPCVLALHDCGSGLCNPHMTVPKEDPNVTSLTGIWERYVLAELFGVADPLSPQLDDASTATHRLRIFTTPHGLGLILPKTSFGSPWRA